jgi:hypothetical protein
MTQTSMTEWRDPVQLYRLRAYRRRMIIVGVVAAALLAAAYWYLYLA